MKYILTLDQGTTSSRAALVDELCGVIQQESIIFIRNLIGTTKRPVESDFHRVFL